MAKHPSIDHSNDLYNRVISAIKADPEAVIRERKCDQLAALKLVIPERIRSLKYARRETYRTLETVKEEIAKKELLHSLAVKDAKDETTGKALYSNHTARSAEELRRKDEDVSLQSLHRERRKLFSVIYGYDEDIEMHERYDASLLEILAMTTAAIEHEVRYGNNGRTTGGSTGRGAYRTKQRAEQRRTELAGSDSEESPRPA